MFVSLLSSSLPFVQTWRLIMSQVHANPDVLSFGDNPSLLQKLQDSNKLLSMVQKRLADYLDKKRAAFARFYFLSNDELLAILSSVNQEPAAVQPHLKKIFENIDHIEFDKVRTRDDCNCNCTAMELGACFRGNRIASPWSLIGLLSLCLCVFAVSHRIRSSPRCFPARTSASILFARSTLVLVRWSRG